MFIVIGCLGTVVAEVDTIEAAVVSVLSQVSVGVNKQNKMRNALGKLTSGSEYHVEYGGSGCTIRRS